MAPRSTSRMQNSLAALRAAGDIYSYVHPDYRYYKPDWDLIRDLVAGERRVKEQGRMYLPALGKDAGTTYDSYKDRAVYVNMVARTVNGLVGTVFRREAKILGITPKTRDKFKHIGLNGSSLNLFAKGALAEIFTVGRVGVLVDRDAGGVNPPYFSMYQAENILSWRTKNVDGEEKLVYVLLREIVENAGHLLNGFIQTGLPTEPSLIARYRVLHITDSGEYVQDIYDSNPNATGTPTLNATPSRTITPTLNGSPLREIPMVIIGPNSPSADIQRSPILDIANLNVAHYRTSAQLEHGRYFTALPVYYVSRPPGSSEQAEYVVGPSVVWETAAGEKPGIIEFFGSGLSSLSQSLVEKEEAISQLGGRIMGIRSAATSESEIIFKLKQANEMSVLINATESMAAGFTELVRLYLEWENNDDAKTATVGFNQDFKSLNIGAREMRALGLLYQSNILPIKEVFRVLQETEFIADDVTLEEFLEMLDDPKQFPNQPDVAAMRRGFPDAMSELSQDNLDTTLGSTEKLAGRDAILQKELQRNELRAKEALAARTAETAVKVAKARPAPAAPGQAVNPTGSAPKPKNSTKSKLKSKQT
jgi:hypothetical protein